MIHKMKDLMCLQFVEHRNLVSKYLFDRTGVKYSKENILITPGSKEAMLLMHITFNGEILTPAPSWVSYEPQAETGSNKVHWLETSRWVKFQVRNKKISNLLRSCLI